MIAIDHHDYLKKLFRVRIQGLSEVDSCYMIFQKSCEMFQLSDRAVSESFQFLFLFYPVHMPVFIC